MVWAEIKPYLKVNFGVRNFGSALVEGAVNCAMEKAVENYHSPKNE